MRPFDWRNIAQRHLELFKELIAVKRRSVYYGRIRADADCEMPTSVPAQGADYGR